MLTSFFWTNWLQLWNFFPENNSTLKKSSAISVHPKAFSREVLNWRKIHLKLFQWAERQKIATQLQQTAALRFPSSILAVTGKRDFQFSKLYNINRALEPNIPCFEYAAMIQIKQNKFYVVLCSCCLVLDSCCPVLCSCCLVLSRGVLMLSRVVLCCVMLCSCCLVLSRVCHVFTRVVF